MRRRLKRGFSDIIHQSMEQTTLQNHFYAKSPYFSLLQSPDLCLVWRTGPHNSLAITWPRKMNRNSASPHSYKCKYAVGIKTVTWIIARSPYCHAADMRWVYSPVSWPHISTAVDQFLLPLQCCPFSNQATFPHKTNDYMTCAEFCTKRKKKKCASAWRRQRRKRKNIGIPPKNKK